ncbi:MAG: hypothetical protein ACI9X4_002441 [Glaciecola sp.]|jgi:hypothetical protein
MEGRFLAKSSMPDTLLADALRERGSEQPYTYALGPTPRGPDPRASER